MPKLIGFEPTIKLELQFTGLELLHLFHGAKMHYDGACQATAAHAGDGAYKNDAGFQRNGLLVTTLMRMEEYDWNSDSTDEEFLSANVNATVVRAFTWREVDLLCKISEQFNLIATLQTPPLHFNESIAAGIMLELCRALNDAADHTKVLDKQEVERRALIQD